MTANLGIERSNDGLKEAAETIEELLKDFSRQVPAPISAYPLETHNLLLAARQVVNGALSQTRNVGLHFNRDLTTEEPQSIPEFLPPEVEEPQSSGSLF